ncbi:MAG: DUF3576 domain-containing protein [Sphingorhabdus sp.]|uniref:DUF3576 domain-containing protein n=1 Tax=Sphingorhabdus sp. TaxID=1902408 RepID=UPI0025DA4410|nr:DUF3576 domain-containing protein [Sphingorhabdus sp.]MCO4091432.1 DUF3576 domain-containing protein [Sphingorhabdus sp.]
MPPVRILLSGALLVIIATLPACTAIENDLGRGLAYGMESRTLTRKVDENRALDKVPSGINAYLWRASLDAVKAIPLVAADPGKGLILTDWYSAPSDPDDRTQMKIEILDRDMRPDTLRVSLVRQQRQDGVWVDAPVMASTAQNLEESIFVRARDIRGW